MRSRRTFAHVSRRATVCEKRVLISHDALARPVGTQTWTAPRVTLGCVRRRCRLHWPRAGIGRRFAAAGNHATYDWRQSGTDQFAGANWRKLERGSICPIAIRGPPQSGDLCQPRASAVAQPQAQPWVSPPINRPASRRDALDGDARPLHASSVIVANLGPQPSTCRISASRWDADLDARRALPWAALDGIAVSTGPGLA